MNRLFAFTLLIISIFCGCSAPKKEEKFNPDAIDLNNQAFQLMLKDKYDSALLLLDQAIRLDSHYHLPHSNKASIFIRQKQWEKALEESEMIIEKNPESPTAWTFAGMMHENLGDTLKAKEHYRKSIELFDAAIDNASDKEQLKSHRLNRAFSLVLFGKEKEGKVAFEELKAEYPNDRIVEEISKMDKEEFFKGFIKLTKK